MTPRRLEGRRILVLRPEGQAEELIRALAAEGSDAVVVPAIRILPLPDTEALDAALRREHDWVVFTSVNGVAAMRETIPPANLTRVAAVGPATAEALASAGVTVDFVPSAYTTVALASAFPPVAGLLLKEIFVSDHVVLGTLNTCVTTPPAAPVLRLPNN